MNKLAFLMTSLALAIASWPAQAAEIPAKYRGEWCDHSVDNFYTRYSPKICKRGGIGYVRMTATKYESGFGGELLLCRVVKVNDPFGKYGDHVITFICSSEEDKNFPLTSSFGIEPSTARLYVERLDDDQRN